MASPFLKLFGKSPFRGLLSHIEVVFHCAEKLDDFFVAVNANDWQEAEALQQSISREEGEADELKRDMRLNLPKDLFLPVARSDVLELLSYQDHIANIAKDIAGLVLGRQMQFPETIQADFATYVQRSIAAVRQAYKSIREFTDLHEAGFGGRETHITEEMIVQLHTIEHDTDEMQIELRKKIFAIEADLPPINVIFIYRIIEGVGQLADQAQKTGDRLQICIAR